MENNLYSLDLETACNMGCTKSCDHALYPHTAKITCMGIWQPGYKLVIRDYVEMRKWLHDRIDAEYVGQNFKFDIKMIYYHLDIDLVPQYTDDTQIMAALSLTKVSPEYLKWYAERRELENDKLPKGYSHRTGSQYSLKVLAPFFLKVAPFWENPTSHDNDEYVLKDCEYTWKLREFFLEKLKAEGLLDFYTRHLMPWARMLTESECKGIKIDKELVTDKLKASELELDAITCKLDEQWRAAYEQNRLIKEEKIKDKYTQMFLIQFEKISTKALLKGKFISDVKREAIKQKYEKMAYAQIAKLETKMNLASSKQLSWILKDYFGLDITNYDDEESTGRQVLNRLAATGREDIKTFLDYRRVSKLVTSFFPTYLEMMHADNTIHCSFNPTGTRTGRLSSSGPNLQQVPGHLHSLFMARPGYKLITRDLSAIEPALAAYYTQDPILCNLLITGGDFHSRNAIIMLGLDCSEKEVKELYPNERKLAKTCGLALLYGAGPYRIQITALTLGWDWPLWKCKEIFDNFKSAYETAFNFKKEIDAYAVSNPIENYFGRKHAYPDPSDIYMKAFNTLVQSTGSDLLLHGSFDALRRFRSEGIDAYPLLYVHDETVFEVAADQAKYCEQVIDRELTKFKLETPYGLIPLKTEGKISDRWEK